MDERATLVAARCPKPLSDSFHGYNVMPVLDIGGDRGMGCASGFPELTRTKRSKSGDPGTSTLEMDR